MEPDREGQVRDELALWRGEFAAALSEPWQWSDLDPDADNSAPIKLDDDSSMSTAPSPVTPTPRGSVTVDVAGADGASSDDRRRPVTGADHVEFTIEGVCNGFHAVVNGMFAPFIRISLIYALLYSWLNENSFKKFPNPVCTECHKAPL